MNAQKIKILFFLVFLLFPSLLYAFTAKVIKIADGDTITVMLPDCRKIRVRLYGIDCPEKKQPYGRVATRFTADRVGNREVEITSMGHDRYGRMVAIVDDLNEALMAAGLAWVYPRYCKAPLCENWKRIEARAREAKSGLWGDTHIPPWEWRRNRR